MSTEDPNAAAAALEAAGGDNNAGTESQAPNIESQGASEGTPAVEGTSAGEETPAEPGADAAGASEEAAATQVPPPPTVAAAPAAAPETPPAPPAPVQQPRPAAPAPKAAPVAQPSGSGVVQQTTSSVSSSGAETVGLFGIAEVDEALKNVPADYVSNLLRLRTYIELMDPKRPTSLRDRCAQQAGLYGVLTNTINRQEEHFRPLWTAIIRLFAAHKDGVFSDTHVFRDFDNIDLKSQDRQAFQRLLSLIQLSVRLQGSSADAKAAQYKQFDFQNALRYGLTDSGRSRLLDYYNVQ